MDFRAFSAAADGKARPPYRLRTGDRFSETCLLHCNTAPSGSQPPERRSLNSLLQVLSLKLHLVLQANPMTDARALRPECPVRFRKGKNQIA